MTASTPKVVHCSATGIQDREGVHTLQSSSEVAARHVVDRSDLKVRVRPERGLQQVELGTPSRSVGTRCEYMKRPRGLSNASPSDAIPSL